MITKEKLQEMNVELDEQLAEVKKKYYEYNYYKGTAQEHYNDLLKYITKIGELEIKKEIIGELILECE